MLVSAVDLFSTISEFLAARITAASGRDGAFLPAHREALLVLAHPRCDDTYARLAAGNSPATPKRSTDATWPTAPSANVPLPL